MKDNTSLRGFRPNVSANILNGGGYVLEPAFPFALGSNVAFNVKSISDFTLIANGEWAGSFQYNLTTVPTIDILLSCNISAQFAAIDDVISISPYINGIQCAESIVLKQFIAHNSFTNFTYIDQLTLNTNDYIALYMSSINGNELQAMEMNIIINTL